MITFYTNNIAHIIMKRIIIFICCILSLSASAQTATKYILGRFNSLGEYDNPFKINGIHIDNYKNSIFVFLTNTTVDYSIELNHFGHRNPEVLDMPICELENLDNIVLAEELLKFKTADDAYRWMLEMLKSKTKLYVIDSNKFYKSDNSLSEPDRMIVMEVHISYDDLPDHIVSPF